MMTHLCLHPAQTHPKHAIPSPPSTVRCHLVVRWEHTQANALCCPLHVMLGHTLPRTWYQEPHICFCFEQGGHSVSLVDSRLESVGLCVLNVV